MIANSSRTWKPAFHLRSSFLYQNPLLIKTSLGVIIIAPMKDSRKDIHAHQSLSGAVFPAFPKDILEYVRQKGVGDGMIDTLKQLPNREYKNESEILSEISKIKEVRSLNKKFR